MKKVLAFLLTVLMLFALVACDLETEPGETKQIVDTSSTSSQTAETKQTETSASTSASEMKPIEPEKKEVTIEEQICFEYDGLKVTAKSLTVDDFWGDIGVKLLIENNSDHDYSVGTDEVIVNNCMASSLFSCSVAAGKKANDTLEFSSSSMKDAGITDIGQIGQIEIYFYVYDSSSYKTVHRAECVTIKTSLYDTVDLKPKDEGKELYNGNGIRIIGKYVDEDTFWGSSIMLCLVNESGQNITISCDDVSVNGFMVSGSMYTKVLSGKYAVDDVSISSSSLEENDITSIDTVELKFHIINSDTYRTIVDTAPITFDAK